MTQKGLKYPGTMNLNIVLVIVLTDFLSIFKFVCCNVKRPDERSERKFEDENSAREKRETDQYSFNVNPLQQRKGEI